LRQLRDERADTERAGVAGDGRRPGRPDQWDDPGGQRATGSASYIQNGTAQQASSNFNISGNGTAGGTLSGNAVSATTRFDLGGLPVLRLTGKSTTLDGLSLGTWATSQGAGNTVIGWEAGTLFPDSNDNTFLGKQSGFPNASHGSSNTLLGAYTKFSDSVSNATAIGANASVERSNSLVLGNGVNVGIGTNALNSSCKLRIHRIKGCGRKPVRPAARSPRLAASASFK
jgi:hypothetical protein